MRFWTLSSQVKGTGRCQTDAALFQAPLTIQHPSRGPLVQLQEVSTPMTYGPGNVNFSASHMIFIENQSYAALHMSVAKRVIAGTDCRGVMGIRASTTKAPKQAVESLLGSAATAVMATTTGNTTHPAAQDTRNMLYTLDSALSGANVLFGRAFKEAVMYAAISRRGFKPRFEDQANQSLLNKKSGILRLDGDRSSLQHTSVVCMLCTTFDRRGLLTHTNGQKKPQRFADTDTHVRMPLCGNDR